jgi:hypothetical protein
MENCVSFFIHKKDGVPSISQENVGQCVSILGNNEVGIVSNQRLPILGKLVGISDDNQMCVVQVFGLLKFKCYSSVLLNSRVMAQDGKIIPAPIGGRGLVVSFNPETKDCEVLL